VISVFAEQLNARTRVQPVASIRKRNWLHEQLPKRSAMESQPTHLTTMDAVRIRDEVTNRVLAHDYSTGPLLLLAGPGTGKSFNLKQTIQRQIANGRSLQDFYAMTLTNAAAGKFEQEVKTEIADTFDAVSTVHFRAKGLLHKYADLVGLPKSFRILSGIEAGEILADIQQDFKSQGCHVGKKEMKRLLKTHQKAAGDLTRNESDFSELFVFYRHFYEALDWFDVMLLACQILAENDDVRTNESDLNPFILVDEYQDLNRADQRFIHLLCNDRTTLLAVGDDDQSIYGGRFADATGIINFQKLYPKAVKISLPVCSRCPTQILRHAHELITKNSCRDQSKEKLMAMPKVDERTQKGLIASVSLKSGKVEAAFLARALRCLTDLRIPAEEILVLCGNQDMGVDLLTAIAKEDDKLPLQNCFAERTKFGAEQVLNHLQKFLDNYDDNLALRMLLTSLIGLNAANIRSLRVVAARNKVSLWSVATGGNASSVLKKSALNKIQTFIACATQSQGAIAGERLRKFAEVYPQLAAAASVWEAAQTITPESSRDESRAMVEQAAGIRFMTLHKSKGLDARYVFIPFLEKDLFGDKDVEEKRRLFYVGITRARTAAILTWAKSRHTPSRYKVGCGDIFNRSRHDFLTQCGLSDDCDPKGVLCALGELAQYEQSWLKNHGH
jgi:DNA helicase-2/ATP-dependent DNA helicase PcrA